MSEKQPPYDQEQDPQPSREEIEADEKAGGEVFGMSSPEDEEETDGVPTKDRPA